MQNILRAHQINAWGAPLPREGTARTLFRINWWRLSVPLGKRHEGGGGGTNNYITPNCVVAKDRVTNLTTRRASTNATTMAEQGVSHEQGGPELQRRKAMESAKEKAMAIHFQGSNLSLVPPEREQAVTGSERSVGNPHANVDAYKQRAAALNQRVKGDSNS